MILVWVLFNVNLQWLWEVIDGDKNYHSRLPNNTKSTTTPKLQLETDFSTIKFSCWIFQTSRLGCQWIDMDNPTKHVGYGRWTLYVSKVQATTKYSTNYPQKMLQSSTYLWSYPKRLSINKNMEFHFVIGCYGSKFLIKKCAKVAIIDAVDCMVDGLVPLQLIRGHKTWSIYPWYTHKTVL